MSSFFQFVKLMRPHQWVKNGFVFTGLVFGHAWGSATLVAEVMAAAAAFCLVSSSVYIVNDLADRERDRAHPEKCHRPLAAGRVSVTEALVLAVLLALGGLALGAWASSLVLLILLGYGLTNLGYSFGLKQVVILDVFLIAAGFMLRILAGTVGVGIPPSNWLLLCGFTVTLFLGFCKRRSEVVSLAEECGTHRRVLEQYTLPQLDKMIGVTAACAIMSYSLYTLSPETVRAHGTDRLIYTVPFVVYGMFRYLHLLHRRGGGGDPARDMLRDGHVLASVALWLTCVLWVIG